ncbi:protein COFACTOR ASSEMBLY OF COMPLEX C SUBUNIT B CCB2, chloroplastic isoform X3 [Diospyros lotus]|uniref:protein COFACTOR ASSEMBLY OF COMPLEX C SUBUNIT B CCB2, chloroplastic isoform X3 n=1 Tax=Diospyros lotus TaxID=55363 RepID=UPI0022591AF9|nr:protein COFACTOR ASSEMBLY OF COMPLEX C SUBUNIT B CCB2, chloroplastic isoform X3 [Diospyros lotus]
MSSCLCSNPLIPLGVRANTFDFYLRISNTYTRKRKPPTILCTRLDNSERATARNQQQLNFSVLRFTFGIPGVDESYLPRWIGYAFGSLLLVNRFLGSDSTTITPAQLRSEALGLSLAAFSIILPYLGKFLKGASPVDQIAVPESAEQIFVMSQAIADNVKEDLAWGTYVLLRNTNTISVEQIQQIGLSDLEDILYFPQGADSELWEMLPEGTRSVLVQPVWLASKGSAGQVDRTDGFILLASSISYAYSNKDRAWIGAVANKFKGKSISADL